MVSTTTVSVFVLIAFLGVNWALPLEQYNYILAEVDDDSDMYYQLVPLARHVRSTQSNQDKKKGENESTWRVQPNLSRGDDDNTKATVKVQRNGENNEVHAEVTQVFDGPDKSSKPKFSIGGSFDW